MARIIFFKTNGERNFKFQHLKAQGVQQIIKTDVFQFFENKCQTISNSVVYHLQIKVP